VVDFMTARLMIGDVRQRIKEIPDGSVDLVCTSPPFLALRRYGADNENEMGSEATPAEFIDALLSLTAEFRRVLAPHGSIAVELGDTFSGSGGAGGDYNEDGLRAGQAKFDGSALSYRRTAQRNRECTKDGGRGWPLAKSLCLTPYLYPTALAYGRNLLTGQASPAGQWMVRNMIAWCLDGDTVVYARTPKGEGPTRLLHLAQNFQPGQWDLWDGQRWAPVLGWSASEADDAIEIEFRNGERVSATRNHEWPTERGLLRTDQIAVGDVVRSVTLPEPADAQHPSMLPDERIGWFVGMFLAEGSFDSRDRIQISGHRNESGVRLDRLRALAESYDGTATAHEYGEGNESTVVVRSPILTAVVRRYLGGDGARNKCLRAAAWRRSNQFLNAVLEGYLEGDGHYDVKNDRWRLGFTDNPWLARDLRVLSARLGYRCHVRRLPRAADPRGGQFAGTANFYHRGEIRTEVRRDFAPIGQVVALRASKRRRFFDIGVEGEPHLFALGSGILTHNCRPNPPVGDLADKVRPGTSYITVATTSPRRWFDLDAVREPHKPHGGPSTGGISAVDGGTRMGRRFETTVQNPAGAPPLDWWDDDYDPDDPVDAYTLGHMTLVQATQPYRGSHFAVWPAKLVQRLILMMCPAYVCECCGTALGLNRDIPTAMPTVRGADHEPVGDRVGTESHPVLFDDMRERVDGEASGIEPWLDSGPEGLHPHPSSPASDVVTGGLCDAASARDGGGVGPQPAGQRGGPPHQRREGRQPNRESGSARQARARQEAEAPGLAYDAVPALWRVDPGAQSCPRCSGPIRAGRVLDPFCGSGTTLAVATGCGRDAIGIELYEHNAHLIRERVGMFLEEVA
jgi:hypothetical protein